MQGPYDFRYCLRLVFNVGGVADICKVHAAPFNGGMSDRVMHAQIWKLDIANIAQDYTTVLLNFELSSPVLLPLKTTEMAVHTLCFTQLNYSTFKL